MTTRPLVEQVSLVPVIREDRAAAADVIRRHHVGNLLTGTLGEIMDAILAIDLGRADDFWLVQAFANHRASGGAMTALLAEVLVDDPNGIGAGIPDEAIEAGIAVWQQAETDGANYIAGVTTDWDEGMIVAAIFKAVARTFLAKVKQGDEG